MKRFHVHAAVVDIEQSIEFYSKLFAGEPTVRKPDYAKWMLDDPRVNFAISKRGQGAGINHLGIQIETAAELDEVSARLNQLGTETLKQDSAACCYAKSDKHWVTDPQGLVWETFHTLAEIPIYGEDGTAQKQESKSTSACCIPLFKESTTPSEAPCCISNQGTGGDEVRAACC